jgi:hypothetical protein
MERKTAMLKTINQTIKQSAKQLQVNCNMVLNYIYLLVITSMWNVMTYDRDVQFISIGYIWILTSDDIFIK